MARFEVRRKIIVDRFGEDDNGEVQAQVVENVKSGDVEMRLAYYNPDGRYGRNAATFSPDEETVQKTIEAFEELGEYARKLQKRRRVESALDDDVSDDKVVDLLDAAEKIGIEEALDRLS